MRPNFPPPPRVTAYRPGPTWPLRVNHGATGGYDNLQLDIGDDEETPKCQVRSQHMTREQFLAVPQPDLELQEAGEKGKTVQLIRDAKRIRTQKVPTFRILAP